MTAANRLDGVEIGHVEHHGMGAAGGECFEGAARSLASHGADDDVAVRERSPREGVTKAGADAGDEECPGGRCSHAGSLRNGCLML